MRCFIILLAIGLAAAYHHDDCKCENGCGPGYEKSFLDYNGKFKGGARRFVPIYEKTVSAEKNCIIKGGKGASECGCRYKRSCGHHEDCQCERGCGPGYEKSYLDYCGNFKGGARRFVPIYEKTVSAEKNCIIKGGKGASECGCRYKRSCGHHEDCKCECGCGPGYEKSFLDYNGNFKGGARRFVPIYEKTVSAERNCIIKGGKGAQPCEKQGYYH